MFYYIDPNYILYVMIPGLLISLFVQVYLSSTFKRWANVANSAGLTGLQVGKKLFDSTSLKGIPVELTPGTLSDHFDPHHNVVRLSADVAKKPSVAAMAVVAHELGHVQQYQTGSGLIKVRNILLPALQFSPTLSYICFLLGFMFNMADMIWFGIFFFGLMVLFSVLTLPVELDASRRGMNLLNEAGLLNNNQDASGARKVLNAAAMTYLAAAVSSLLQLFYYVSVAQRQTRRSS